jgi:2'-5' RNA ligase
MHPTAGWSAVRSVEHHRVVESAVLLLLEPLAPYVDHWRRDAWQSLEPPVRLSDAVPPHITLRWPWHPDPDDPEPLGRLRAVAADVAPFDLRFRRVAAFEDGPVWLLPDPDSPLEALFARLVQAFPEFPPYDGSHDVVRLHVTVSISGGAKVANEVAAAAIDVIVPIQALAVGNVDGAGRWKRRLDVPLGAGLRER